MATAKGLSDEQMKEVKEAVLQLKKQGKSNDEIAKAVREKFSAGVAADDPTWAVPTTIVPVVVA
jgi:hypothetical protein